MSLLVVVMLSLMIACGKSEDVTVTTSIGDITGEVEEVTFDGLMYNVTTFLGIPFAEPPTGTRRFNRPIQKGKFTNTFIAKTMAPECVQNWAYLKGLGMDPTTMRQEEDCLYLNIFVPGRGPFGKETKQAVMIYIFGGDFQMGSQNAYDAKGLVGLNDIILVTLNYRVSLLGFLSTAEDNWSGNYGLWDQHMAIKWVHDHVESFGGDPLNVTIFGNSAGGGSVIYQALYEGNQGFFQRAIAQSGSANNPWAYDTNPRTAYHNFVNKSNCLNNKANAVKVIECLRNLTVEKITELVGYSDTFRPIRDGQFVKVSPKELFRNVSNDAWDILKRFGRLDVIIGVTSSDGGLFISTIDSLTNTNKSAQPIGYSKAMFETIISPQGLKIAKVQQNKIYQRAIIHQYVDWSDPDNTERLFDKTVDLLSDVTFNSGITKTAMAHSDTGENGRLFFYVFDHKSLHSDSRLRGATHTEDVPFVLGFPPRYANAYQQRNETIPQNEIELSKKMMEYWTAFAKTGDPNTGGETTWPQYDTMTQKYIRFQATVSSFPVEDHFAAGRMNFWHNLIPTLDQECDETCPKCEDEKISGGRSNYVLSLLIIAMLTLTRI